MLFVIIHSPGTVCTICVAAGFFGPDKHVLFIYYIYFFLIYIKPCPVENDTGEMKVHRRKNRNIRGGH